MRLTLIFITVLLTLALAGPSRAADTGTYRPGQAYLSLTAPNANLCAAQCNGDAQCKGWNFVRVKPNAPTGLCEFNSVRVAPVPSPVSISGDNSSARASSRLIPAGTRTIRVGQPAPVPQPRAAQPRPANTAPEPNQPRRVVRRVEPVPQKHMPTPSSYRPPVQAPTSQPQIPLSQPAFRHSLDTAPQAAATPRARETNAGIPNDQDMIAAVQRRQLEAMINRAPPVPSQAAQPPTAAAAPVDTQTQFQPSGTALPPRMPQPQFPAGMTAQQAEQTLFGSLYDDVTAPKSLTPEDLPADPDAPIATVKSVPVEKISVDNLMAGAPNPG